ncbi:hypothetical protein QEN19_001880 [Hanseniaspora menglaensis]
MEPFSSNVSFSDSDINSLTATTSNLNIQSGIHQPKLYKKTSSSQVSLRRFSILQSDNDISDDLIKPSISHNESDVEVLSNSKILTNDELKQEDTISSGDDDIIYIAPSTPSSLKPTSGNADGKDLSSVLDVRFVDYYLDHTTEESHFASEIIKIIKLLKIKKWYKEDLKSKNLIIRKISGAMTNAIFQLKYKENDTLQSLLLRVYGPNVDSIIDRDYELQVLARLSNLRIGPKLFGCFNNGRFEEFLDNSITLTKDDVRKDLISYKVSKRMRELHFFVPLTKEEKNEASITWKRVDNWLKTISSINSKILKYVTQFEDFESFMKIVEIYRQYLNNNLNNKTPSFTHCDTQYGNLLKVEEEIVVIDFEYSGPNPPSFDIANHFSEWMHDYHSAKPEYLKPSKYPSREQIDTFLKGYNFLNSESLYDDIIRSRALVNLHWCLWGILQSGVLVNEKNTVDVEEKEEDLVDEDHGEGTGADIETFDCLLYSREKFKIVLGDWQQLGIIQDCENKSFKSYKLDAKFISTDDSN